MLPVNILPSKSVHNIQIITHSMGRLAIIITSLCFEILYVEAMNIFFLKHKVH